MPIVVNKCSIIACLIKHFTYPQNHDIKYKIRNWLDIVCDIISIWFSLIPISISPLPRDHAWKYYRFMFQYFPLSYATKATRHIFGYIASVAFLTLNLCYQRKLYVCMGFKGLIYILRRWLFCFSNLTLDANVSPFSW